jgi:hypothetical protein
MLAGMPAGRSIDTPAGRCSGTVRYGWMAAPAGTAAGALARCSTPPTMGRTV